MDMSNIHEEMDSLLELNIKLNESRFEFIETNSITENDIIVNSLKANDKILQKYYLSRSLYHNESIETIKELMMGGFALDDENRCEDCDRHKHICGHEGIG